MSLVSIILAISPMVVSEIKTDEVVSLYPCYASLESSGEAWILNVQGKVFEPEANSWRRSLTVRAVAKTLQVEAGTPEAAIFDRRIRLFMVDNERGKKVAVRIGEKSYPAGESGADGHFRATVRLPATLMEQLASAAPAQQAWITLEVVLPADDPRRFTGRVQRIGPRGLSIISDIDDTIKHTQVRQRKAMLANTMLRPFRAVPGMAALYRRAAREGAAVHYVSGSPWQLYAPLESFLRQAGFPSGSFHLKKFRLKDSSVLNLLGSQEDYKAGHIEPILEAFPRRRFLLVGDSGEQDPEIYGRLARAYPRQIAGVWVRNVTEESADGARMQAALADVPADRWRLFDHADELEPALKALIAAP